MANVGKPSKYSRELAERIGEIIATSEKSMKTICEEVGIGYGTHLQWLIDNEEYAMIYTRAKEDQAELMGERIREISDTPMEGVKTKTTANGVEVTTGDMIEHRKLQVETRKWLMAKLKPKKYGDKVDITTDGKSMPSPVIQILPKSE